MAQLTPLEKDIVVELNPARVKSIPIWILQQWENRARTCFISFESDGEDFPIPNDYIAVLHYKKPDKKEVVKYLVIENDTVAMPFDEQMTAASGTAIAQIVFMTPNDDIKFRSPLLYFSIVPGMNQGRIKSASQFSVLNATMDKIRETFVALPEVDKMVRRVEDANEKAVGALRKATDTQGKADLTLKTAEKCVQEAKKTSKKAEAAAGQMKKWMADAEETYITANEVKPKKIKEKGE